jgi:hypothetical protein
MDLPRHCNVSYYVAAQQLQEALCVISARNFRVQAEVGRMFSYCLVPALRAVCDEVLDPAGPLTAWYPEWPDIANVVDPAFRHVTLGWLNLPTAAIRPGSWELLADTLEQEFRDGHRARAAGPRLSGSFAAGCRCGADHAAPNHKWDLTWGFNRG